MANEEEIDIDLQHYLDILLRRRWIVLAFATITVLSTALVVFTQRPQYQAKALLLIEKERSSGRMMGDGVTVEATADDYYQTQYMLLKSDSLLESVHKRLGLERHEDFAEPSGFAKLKKAVNIAPVRRSRLVHVEAVSHDAALAARVANGVAEGFVRQNLENQLFISKEILEALEVDARSSEGRRLQEGLPAVVNNPLVQNLKAEHAKLQAQVADMGKRYTEKHPAMLSFKSNMTALQMQIQAETDRIVQSLKTELSGQLKGNNVRVVDLAKEPKGPFKPRKARALAIAIIMGCLGGFLLAMLVETLDQSIRVQEDVENKLGQAFLGLIPFLQMPDKSSEYQTLLTQEPSLTSEAFRNLRTMVDFAEVSDKDKSLIVTSSVQEEGKSYVVTNLAVAFSQLGERVLLIDGDFRRPKLHRNFRLHSKKGLSDFLAIGKDVSELGELVQGTDVPGLKVLVCGTRPPNPSELLNTPRLGAALAWARDQFDRILVDCPPMFPIHDTLLWGRNIRGAVFVTRYGKTRVQLIKDACARLASSGGKVLGVVTNAAKPGGLTYAGYGYYYRQYYDAYQSGPAEIQNV
ncbi:MAG: polysaccharide biosynthesis tyrosine autokinase [Elusimicrobiota bacterium]